MGDILSSNGLIVFFIFIIGLCLGSFYNVVILRSLKGESIISPPSKCPKCGNKLKPWHNIPVISYIFLKGKCAFCEEKISIQYPIVEFVTGVLFSLIYLKFGFNYVTLLALFSVSCLIIMTGTDIKEKIVDCNLAIAMAIVGFIYAFAVSGFDCFKDALLGALLGFAVIELIARSGYLLKKGRAMGEADSYVAGALGALVGYHDIWTVLLCSLFTSMLFILPQYWYNRYKAKDALILFLSSLFIISIAFNTIYAGAVWTLVALSLSGLVLSFFVIKNIKESEKLCYLPFVPALSAGFLYYIIFVL